MASRKLSKHVTLAHGRKQRVKKHLKSPEREERIASGFIKMEHMWQQLMPGIKFLP